MQRSSLGFYKIKHHDKNKSLSRANINGNIIVKSRLKNMQKLN